MTYLTIAGDTHEVVAEAPVLAKDLLLHIKQEAKNLAMLIAIDIAEIDAATRKLEQDGAGIVQVLVEYHSKRLEQHQRELNELYKDLLTLGFAHIERIGGVSK